MSASVEYSTLVQIAGSVWYTVCILSILIRIAVNWKDTTVD
ncbi:hypothetical protein MHB84_21040 [Paenibacillus sp. FSL F4-0087]|nr:MULTISPECIES: hypothetical protein [Paenibacillus]